MKDSKLTDFIDQWDETNFPAILEHSKKLLDKNKLKSYERNDTIYFEALQPVCPHCIHRSYEKMGFGNRQIRILKKGTIQVKVRRYKCLKCGRSFQTDISHIVDDYKNISKGIEEEIMRLYQLTNDTTIITNSLRRKYSIEISRTSVEKIIKENNGE